MRALGSSIRQVAGAPCLLLHIYLYRENYLPYVDIGIVLRQFRFLFPVASYLFCGHIPELC